MCSSSSSKKSQAAAYSQSERQFQWQQDQARKAEEDAIARREAMASGLAQINEKFSAFDDDYYDGIAASYLEYANPQIQRQQNEASRNVRSSLANRGKLGSSTAARQYGDLATTFSGIYRDAEIQADDYATQHRGAVNSARQTAVGQMYASESPDVGLQSAAGSVAGLQSGPAFEPVSAILSQAAKFATIDYNNSLYGGGSSGLFSPMTNRMAGSGSTSGQVRTIK